MVIKLLLAFFLITSSAHAFTLNNSLAATFGKDEVLINMATHDCDQIPYTNDEILSMADEGMNKFWNRVPTSKLKIRRGSHVVVSNDFATERLCTSNSGSCTVNPALATETEILISCNKDTGSGAENFPSNSVLAVTLPINTQGSTINGSVILLNNKSGTAMASLSREEFISVLAHEVGHAIGLGHSKFNDSLMLFENLKNRQHLGQDDHDGISYLYPREQPTSCGSVTYIDKDTTRGMFSLTLVALLMFILLKGREFRAFGTQAHNH
jgi:predicted Zn-dependent protease